MQTVTPQVSYSESRNAYWNIKLLDAARNHNAAIKRQCDKNVALILVTRIVWTYEDKKGFEIKAVKKKFNYYYRKVEFSEIF